MAIAAPLLTPYSPIRTVGKPLQPPSPKHPFGTNRLGYDMWSRTVYGARTILSVVFLAIFISMVVGVPLGLLSGYYGGLLDRILSMIMDAIYAFPSLVLAIALAVALGPSIFNAAIAIAVVYVPTYFRMIRGQVLSIKESAFIEAARALGLPATRILFHHIMPHTIPSMMVVFSLSAADAVLTEAALSFLGLSIQPPTPDWGYDLSQGRAFMLSGYWWLVFFPGLMITLLATGFALIGEGLSEHVRREGL
ncbi:MAG: ABC transporter permease [Pyrodictiaceae archaeon]